MINHQRQEFMLRSKLKVIIDLPVDLTIAESTKIKKYIKL